MTDPWNPSNLPPPTQQVPPVTGPYTEQIPQVPGSQVEPTIGVPGGSGLPGPAGPPPPYLPPPPPGTDHQGAPLPPPPGTPGPPRRGGLSVLTIVALTLGAVILVGSLAAIVTKVVLIEPTTTTTTTSPPTTASTPTTPTTPTASTTAMPTDLTPYTTPTPGADFTTTHDVLSLPDGLFCRNLRALGYSYSAAVDYWRQHGQTDRMDADRNGIPCETVYSRSDVVAYWGNTSFTPSSQASLIWDLPSGLLCRELKARGFDAAAAIEYYLYWGRPEQMDADHNGIPCETVYSDAESVWYGNGD